MKDPPPEISARRLRLLRVRHGYELRFALLHGLVTNGTRSGHRRRRSIRRWVLAMAALALSTALAIAPSGPAEAQAPCNNGVAVPDSTNSGLVEDCNTLLSLMGTLAGTANLNWSENTPIGSWNGISVAGNPQRVTGLELPSWSLSGSIPSGLGDLSNLTNLNLSGNGIIGSIPSGLGDLSNLTNLNLSGNQLTGTIPSELGDLSSLGTLDLSTNQLHGVIPSELGDLSSLSTLNLSKNGLTGTTPSELGDLSSLGTLDLSTNQLHGVIPSELGDLSSLSTLNLSKNGLTGTIPSELGDLSSLGTLDLSTNQLHGVIPSELGDLSSLSTLNLSKNGLTGSIPSELGGLSSLSTLNLSDNELTGSIPSKLGNLSSLTELKLFENNLDWEIPEELNQLDNLREVDLKDNFGLIGPAHLNFTGLSKAYLGYMETETWAVANFSSATGWSLSGTDSGKFAITSDGVLTFSSAPDFEAQSNPISVQVTASVGVTSKTAQIDVYVVNRDIALSVSPGSIAEEGQSTQFDVTATLDGGTTRATSTTVTLSLAGSASADDYATTTLNSITIPVNSASATITLTLDPTNDDIVEGDEVVKVVGASGDEAVSPAWITINDGDRGTLSLSGPDTAVAEGFDASFTVTLSDAIGPEVPVEWSVMPGSATSTDYDTSSGTLTFPGGSAANATTTLTLTATDDLLSEVAESFSVSLGAVTGDISDWVSVDPSASSTVATISESDPITVTLSGSSSVAEGESVTYTVSLSPNGVTPTADLTVDYATADGTAGSGDYVGEMGTLTFTSSDTQDKTVTVQTTEDSIAEGDETFSFELSNVAGGGGPTPSLGSPSSITTTIVDDDAEPTDITLSVSRTEVSEGDGMATTTLTATLDGDSTRATSTTVALSLSGSATGSGTDYTGVVPSEMTIPAEAATGTATLIITPTNDEIVEGDETIRVEGTVSNFTVSPAEITINDGDVGTVSLSGSVTAVLEGNDASYTVSLSDAIGRDVTVGWSVTPDSGDFSTPSGSVTFAAGSTPNATTTLTLTATDDLLSEVAESFTVSLGAVTGDISDRVSVDPSASSTVATISESDPITVTLSGDSSVEEGESVTYTVSLSPNGVTPTADLTVHYATTDDTADSDDYEGVLGTLTFTSSDTEDKTVTVQTAEDSIAEGDETFSFYLSGVAGGGGPTPFLGEPPSITTTIYDDDAEPTSITLSVSRTEVSEGDGRATSIVVTATLDGDSTRATSTTVALSSSGSATGSGTDYTGVVPSEMTIAAEAATGTATLIITPMNDEIVEGDETIVVEGTVSGFTVSSASITIQDGDVGTVSLSGPGAPVVEGSDASFTVTLSDAIGRDVTVGWSVTPDSGDFSTPSGSVTFSAGSTANATTTLTLTATDDLLSEVAESFTVMLGTVTGDISDRMSVDLSASSTVATISESDPITVTLSGDSSVEEGESATYTVSLSPNGVTPTADLTVHYATADDTADSDDYEGVLGTLTFTSSDAEDKTVTVQTTEDSIAEGSETFSLSLSDLAGGGGPTASLGSPPYITTTIIDDDRRRIRRPPANDAPTFNEGATTTRAALENSEVGTEVGEPVLATDRDGDRLEYWLWGTDRASFDVNPRTGQLSSKTALDREIKNEYLVRMSVRDGRGRVDGIRVTIIVENVDEPPERPAVPDVKACSHSALVVNWSAPDNQGPEITNYDVRYREAGQAFQDAGFHGTGTSLTLENLQSETTYEVQVRAANAEGTSPWSESGQCETEEAPPPPTPTPAPTAEPTPAPTAEPTPAPTAEPTPAPTAEPTPAPTAEPTPAPTAEPTPAPTAEPTPTPTAEPAPSEADGGDEGFPWWAIVVVVIGVVAGVVLIIVVRRSRR